MPFELGMTIAWSETANRDHYWIVLESRKYRLQKSLSDLNGYDHFIHNGTIVGVFQALLDAFDKPDVSLARMNRIYKKAPEICRGNEGRLPLERSVPSECIPSVGHSRCENQLQRPPLVTRTCP